MKKPAEALIVALDFSSAAEALKLVDALGESVVFYKVGMQLYFAAGNSIITELQKRNKLIFLDLKINDIPETVGKAVDSLVSLGVRYLTLFTQATQIEAAAAILKARGSDLKLLNVTVLTSQASTFAEVDARARLSLAAGAHGLICSGLEAAELRRNHGQEPILVTPGIRLAEKANEPNERVASGSRKDDQVRIVTPGDAIRGGATNIVVGRPITQAQNPRAVAQAILAEIEGALG
ncbi:orotidine-5'-phosphate decarboxylase [Turneriella parva]|uniref:Orotidine 5'-phosphate decarboxylase n=1 Tax=Turneriella parva (strain ATCC BAA-1111 / DSM 21527 / NCTC 11395 / H) TaxID=869212 RepID=I4B3I7_TURPD|nr:orotidine-5'-phosphate decarboxylase [Turneriella parva]AFM11844.1 orotidine-5'-phosphate decarboxylase [Turneriella parva DSM 21527]